MKTLAALAVVVLTSAAELANAQAPVTPSTTTPPPSPSSPTANTPAPPPPVSPPPANVTSVPNVSANSSAQDCISYKDADTELKSPKRLAGPQLLLTTYFLPAGSTVDVVLRKEFDPKKFYFGYIEATGGQKILGKQNISITQIPETNSLVLRGLASKTDSLIRLELDNLRAGFWESGTLFIYDCAGGSPHQVSQLPVRISSSASSAIAAVVATFALYLLGVLAARSADPKEQPLLRYFDPIVMTAGSDGKGSLSKLQIAYFTIIVFGLMLYIVLRTGVLSDLSQTILYLLGITGIASAAAKGTDVKLNRIAFDNWAWFVRKGWLPSKGVAEVNKARWSDIFTTDGEFDVYRYQSFLFTLIVGVALLVNGISQLASFEIPTTLLGILGLSQAVYIGGKLVTPTVVPDLNSAMEEVRQSEQTFINAASSKPEPGAAADAPITPPASLASAITRAGKGLYDDYMNKVRAARDAFCAVTGLVVSDDKLQPAVSP